MSRIALLESGDTTVDNIGKFVSGRRCEFGDSELGDRFLNSASVHVAQAVTVPFGQSVGVPNNAGRSKYIGLPVH
jgi:hypothetical protein